jgi:23S rRNA pseudouridine2605 synthase
MAKQAGRSRSHSGAPKKRSFAPRKDDRSSSSRSVRKDEPREEGRKPSRFSRSSEGGDRAERPEKRERFGSDDKRPARKPPFKKEFSRDKDEYKRPSEKRSEPREGREEGGFERKRSSRPFDKGEKKPFRKEGGREDGFKSRSEDWPKPFPRRDNDSFRNNEDKRKPFRRKDDDGGYKRPVSGDRERKAGSEDSGFERKGIPRPFEKRERPFEKENTRNHTGRFKSRDDNKPRTFGRGKESGEERVKKPYKTSVRRDYDKKPYGKDRKVTRERSESERPKTTPGVAGSMRLNKYIANSGICSRREADELIKAGTVTVNGKVITEMGFKISPSDIINYGGQTLRRERMIYLLLNKPKDYITTAEDPEGRKTVLHLIQDACKERIYPVGRLDRNTTGVLLFTNDGELTKKLTHPKHGVKKIYHVELDKALKKTDFDNILEGVELEDGVIKADDLSYVGDGDDKKQVGIEIHSGKNRIIRRLFEHLGYEVRRLDRVTFAGLTKKDLSRGRWRFLSAEEVSILKMIQ